MQLAQYYELNSFSQFASDLGADTVDKLNCDKCFNNLMMQPNGQPIPVHVEIIAAISL